MEVSYSITSLSHTVKGVKVCRCALKMLNSEQLSSCCTAAYAIVNDPKTHKLSLQVGCSHHKTS